MTSGPAGEPAWTAGVEAGSYRRYTEADLAVLDRMRRLVAGGTQPARAAVLARGDHPIGQLWSYERPTAGHVIDELLDAARRLDAQLLAHRVSRALVEQGVVQAWERLLGPALRRLGDEAGGTTRCVEVEHLLSWSIVAGLHRVSPPTRSSDGTAVLLACAPGEQHSLPLEALHAALAERGVPSVMLGADLPEESLLAAAGRGRSTAIVLWAHSTATAAPEVLELLQPCAPLTIAGGLGWAPAALPRGVRPAAGLEQVLRLLSPDAA